MSQLFRLKNGTVLLSTEAPGGIYNSGQLKKIAELCSKELAIVKATEDQRLALFVKESEVENVAQQLRAMGLGFRHYQDSLHQPVSCLGELCEEHEQPAMATAMDITKEIAAIQLNTPLKIGVNGCARCCTPCHTLDIAVVGDASGYRISLGGKTKQMPEFASYFAEGVPPKELPKRLKAVIETYKSLAEDGESLHDVIERCGVADFVSALAPYSQDAAQRKDPFADEAPAAAAVDEDSLELIDETPAAEDDLEMIDDTPGEESLLEAPADEDALESLDETPIADDSLDLSDEAVTEDSLTLEDADLSVADSQLDDDVSLEEIPISREDQGSLEDDLDLAGGDTSDDLQLDSSVAEDELDLSDDSKLAEDELDLSDDGKLAEDELDLSDDGKLAEDELDLSDDSSLEIIEDELDLSSDDSSLEITEDELDLSGDESSVTLAEDDVELDLDVDHSAKIPEDDIDLDDATPVEVSDDLELGTELESLDEPAALEAADELDETATVDTLDDADLTEDLGDDTELVAEAPLDEDLEGIPELDEDLAPEPAPAPVVAAKPAAPAPQPPMADFGDEDLPGDVPDLSDEEESQFEQKLHASIDEESRLIAKADKDPNVGVRQAALSLLENNEASGDDLDLADSGSDELELPVDMDEPEEIELSEDLGDLDASEDLELTAETSDELELIPEESSEEELEPINEAMEEFPEPGPSDLAQIKSRQLGQKLQGSTTRPQFKVSAITFQDEHMRVTFESGAYVDFDLSALGHGEERSFRLGAQSVSVTSTSEGYILEVDGMRLFHPKSSLPVAS